MIKTITECYCDICGISGASSYKVLTLRTFDDTDGMSHYNEPKVCQESLDLCTYCAIRSTNLHDEGVQSRDVKITREINDPYFAKKLKGGEHEDNN